MRKIIKLTDTLTTNDAITNMNEKSGISAGFDTSIIIKGYNINKDGENTIEIKQNKTALPGRTKLLETVFPLTPNMEQHIFINDNVLGEFDAVSGEPVVNPVKAHNTPTAIMPRNNPNLFARRKVEYWCAGDGAMNKTILTQSYESHTTDTKLYHMIPFRFIPVGQDISNELKSLYAMEVVYPSTSPYYGYKGYYYKKIQFESVNGINMTVDKQPYTPVWSDTLPDLESESIGYTNNFKGQKTQYNYLQMYMNITAEEFKEWFEFKDGTLGNATISEIGLVIGSNCARPAANDTALTLVEDLDPTITGYNNLVMNSEVYDSELFAHLTFDPYSVSRENATIDFQYRVYS